MANEREIADNIDNTKGDAPVCSVQGEVRRTGFLSIVQLITMLMSVLRNKLSVVLLSKSGVGLSAIFMNVSNFMSNTSNLGVSFSSIKEISSVFEKGDQTQLQDAVRVVRTWSVWTGLLGILLSLAASPLISYCAFGHTQHIVSFCMLSPMVGFMSVTAGELSILKALRRLKSVAVVSCGSVILTLLLTVPCYILWDISGIIPALLASTLAVMLIHLYMGVRAIPWQVDLTSRKILKRGYSLIRVGVPYIVAGAINTLTGMSITFFINRYASLDEVALYGMGYTLVFSYAGLVFTAVDTDFFPRLSGVHDDLPEMNQAINAQIETCVLLMSPLLVVFALAMPLAVRILYSTEYLPITPMAVMASMHLFFKSMTLPVAYIALAKSDAITYLSMEVIYDLILVVLVVTGFICGGLTGTGVALMMAGVFDWLMIWGVYHHKYGFKPNPSSFKFLVIQAVLVTSGVVISFCPHYHIKAIAGGMVLGVTLLQSFLRFKNRNLSIGIFKRRK